MDCPLFIPQFFPPALHSHLHRSHYTSILFSPHLHLSSSFIPISAYFFFCSPQPPHPSAYILLYNIHLIPLRLHSVTTSPSPTSKSPQSHSIPFPGPPSQSLQLHSSFHPSQLRKFHSLFNPNSADLLPHSTLRLIPIPSLVHSFSPISYPVPSYHLHVPRPTPSRHLSLAHHLHLPSSIDTLISPTHLPIYPYFLPPYSRLPPSTSPDST